ncbi:MAG: rhamnulokinase family protein [Eubacteriales bacterium]
MNKPMNLLGFDLGASNGRAILGKFDGEKIVMEELHRFENNYIDVHGTLYWDILNLYRQLEEGFHTFRRLGCGALSAFGIDSWGVDYGLLDKNGVLLGNPRCYRQSIDGDMEAVWETLPFETLFNKTGIATLNFNTIYQLYRRKRENCVALEQAETLLMIPDLLGYFLTGEKKSEYTNVSTSMLCRHDTGDWDWDIIKALGLPANIFTEIDRAGQLRGCLTDDVASRLGVGNVPFAAVGTHDTASAVAAVPGSGNFAFCSSGTWSLFGVETDQAIVTDQVRKANFSNEGTVQGGFRPLKNIMGLWIIQECNRQWKTEGNHLSWNDIVDGAKAAPALRSIIDPDNALFFNPGNMADKVQDYCQKTGQPVPQTVGEIARCIYESLALKYRWAMERLEEIKGAKLDSLNIVGGGIQNKLLNQMVADSIDRPVITGPIEGAAIGNLLMQAMALGELKNMDELRQVVRNSEAVQTYHPNHSQMWDDGYEKLLHLM